MDASFHINEKRKHQGLTVPVAMMQIRIMRVLVPHWRVAMPMGVWFDHFILVDVIVVNVMHVAMVVFQLTMDMLMFVAFSQMKPEANCHQHARSNELYRRGLSQ